MPKRTKKKRIGKRRAKKRAPKLTMARHRNLYGLNMVELVTEMFRRQLPGPGLKRYQFKPHAPPRAQRRTFRVRPFF
jgi:hypothetical protein